jgi:Cdc6-like AAA superfamily ATPase
MRKAARDAAKMRSALRANLSTVNHVKPWKQAMRLRAPDTADWFNQDPAFQNWKDDRSTAILWCSGKLGVGKTVIMSNVVVYLHTERKQSDIISYYFCRSDHHESLQARNIIGSLACQLLDIQIEHAKDDLLVSLYEDSKDLDSAETVQFLLSRLEHDKTYYILLDGFDECENREIEKIAQLLNTLYTNRDNHLKVLCSSRPELETDLFKGFRPQYRIKLAGKSVDSDIERYIDIELDQRLERNELKLNDPSLILKIAKALREGSHGMYVCLTRIMIRWS